MNKSLAAPLRLFGMAANELMMIGLTLLIGVLLTLLLLFAPLMAIGEYNQKPLGIGGYLPTISTFLGQLLRGQIALDADRNTTATRLLWFSAIRTFQLVGISVALALLLGTVWGALLIAVRGGPIRAALNGANVLLMAIPTFVLLLLSMEVVTTITRRTGVQIAYVNGYGLDKHLVLPMGVLAARGAAYVARAIAVAQDDVMRQDWLQAARARGLGGWNLWRRHMLPALRLPLIGIALGLMRTVVAGSILVDYMVGWGGLGRRMLAFEALAPSQRDYRVGIVAVLILVVMFVLLDVLSDLALRYADPRLRDTV